MTSSSSTEKKLGVRILKTVEEMRGVPQDNLQRFKILNHRLAREVKAYKEFTGKDQLDPSTDYGYTVI